MRASRVVITHADRVFTSAEIFDSASMVMDYCILVEGILDDTNCPEMNVSFNIVPINTVSGQIVTLDQFTELIQYQ